MARSIVVVCVVVSALVAPVVAWGALPDGRVYEQVSPALKNGFDAGAPSGTVLYALAAGDGDGVFYASRGAMGEATRGLQEYSVSLRGADGWQTRSAVPPTQVAILNAGGHIPLWPVPSRDLSSFLFSAGDTFVAGNPESPTSLSGALNLGHADGSVEWVTRPQIANPVPAPGSIGTSLFQPVGGTPDLSTVYFWGAPTLLPEDAVRAPSAATAWGLYEYSHGVLGPAGTLPDGSEDPGGVAPASTGNTNREASDNVSAEAFGNQVSRDGSTLWFVSPDPGTGLVAGPARVELYVRRGGHSTLVSHLPGDPTALAPSGVTPVQTLNGLASDTLAHQYAFGAADGSAAIFQSGDALTADAPSDGSVKSYRYDVATNTVQYLPGVAGATVVVASDDARRFLFGDGNHTRIGVWDDGAIKTLATVGASQVAPARVTASGSVFVFSTAAPVPGAGDSGGVVQVYRYDVAQDRTVCVSCPPVGVVASGDATLANQFPAGTTGGELWAPQDVSADGGRVFFSSPDALVSQDGNGQLDVYEWSVAGGVSLISSGRSARPSFVLDSSASGDDVFFATTEGLVVGDRDGSYDVYDARVDGGFAQSDQTAPCAGDACRSGLSGPVVVVSAGSSRFSGAGDQLPPADGPLPSAKLKLGSRRVSGGRLEVSVSIARPGRVSVSGPGLRAVSKSYAKAGSYRLVVGLSVSGKRSLKSRRGLRLSVRVGFFLQSGPASSVKFVLAAKA
ncbi:MAG TPA: hypothetical protein VLJ42_08565 [Solirubrobacteraceae bacterium]|nr:hypothetical protein [Solirubrobacteraceae bacterium]